MDQVILGKLCEAVEKSIFFHTENKRHAVNVCNLPTSLHKEALAFRIQWALHL